MIIFFIRAFIFFCLIWIFKYSDEELNRNNILNIKYSRMLSSEIRAPLEDKHKCLKEKIYDLKGKSTASFEKKPYALKQNNFSHKEDNESICSDSYQEELNYFMPRKKPQNIGAFNVKHNLKDNSPLLRHYNNIQSNKNLHKSLKKLYSENDSYINNISSSNKRNCIINEDKINAIISYQNKHPVNSAILFFLTIIIALMFFPLTTIFILYFKFRKSQK
ncbi:Plasmodium exported protein, unknown function [Plasmodium malariae]|uniref:Fam-b protein n=1 Tax=Plasmodium malariae TaxID=5858 RepID=A0A1D3PB47_PLAMA|nr:Plasmodium exported protein, unknown function [Plasmodium malariae]SCN12432.1 Plasmodium exported protein, unknown function [Plasmodium malariae]